MKKALIAGAFALLAAPHAIAEDVIQTLSYWDGAQAISSFGVPNTATYGQTITISPGAGTLRSFSFEIGNCSAAVSFRGSIFAWDPSTNRATGTSLFESTVHTLPAGAGFTLVSFNTAGLALAPGTYVFFASTSQDQGGAPNGGCTWGYVNNAAYPDGQFFFQNNGTTIANWTTVAWSTQTRDLAFELTFAPPSTSTLIDTLSGWDGATFISSFGVTNTATYGQTITVPATTGVLSYSFEIGNCSAGVSFRGSIFAWDAVNNRATGASLYESPVYSLPAAANYKLVSFNTDGVVLTPGTYVFFASTSQDQGGAPNSACRFGALTNNTPYPDGQFVFLNNGANAAQWTTVNWDTIARDLAFQVTFVPPPAAALVQTLSAWNGTSFISSFGVVNTATYGQTITIPPGAGPLRSFSFEIGQCNAAVNFRGSIFAWDAANNRAAGASLFESQVYSLAAQANYTLVSFNTNGLELAPGTYVFFASTSQDQGGAPNSQCRFGAVPNNATYGGGQFVFQNNGTVIANWTTQPWDTIAQDLAFQMTFAPPSTATLVDTLSTWNGTTFISSFGVPNTATYGQTITIPAGSGPLLSYSFEIGNCITNAVRFRGSIFAWDAANSRATGTSLYESPAYTIPVQAHYSLVSFNTGSLALAPGTYVFFVSTSQDHAGAPNGTCRFGSVANTSYAGGQFVFLNNGPNFANWTTTAWSTITQDLAFQATFANNRGFYPLEPCRIVDTRGGAPLGGPPLTAGSSRTYVITGQCGIPSNAKSIAFNLTVTNPTAAGNLTLYPGGTPLPLASTVNYIGGQTRANNGIGTLGAAGDLTITAAQVSGTTDVILDVSGYFR